MPLATIDEIRAEVQRRAALIGAAGSESLPTYGRSSDFARPHIEVDRRGYHFVVVERGVELTRRTTSDLDTLLFEVFQAVTFELACEYELAHRVQNEDCRRAIFRLQVELLSRLSAQWGRRQAEAHERILAEHPLNDEQ